MSNNSWSESVNLSSYSSNGDGQTSAYSDEAFTDLNGTTVHTKLKRPGEEVIESNAYYPAASTDRLEGQQHDRIKDVTADEGSPNKRPGV
jgi:hypothetical protein